MSACTSKRSQQAPLLVSYVVVGFLAAAIDVGVIVSVAVASGVLYHFLVLGRSADLQLLLGAGVAVAIFFTLIQTSRGCYRERSLLEGRNYTLEIITAWCMVFAIIITIAFLLKVSSSFSRGSVLLFFVFGVTALVVVRTLLVNAVTNARASGAFRCHRVALLEVEDPSGPYDVSKLEEWGYDVDRRIMVRGSPNTHQSIVAACDELSKTLIAAADANNPIDQILIIASWSNRPVIESLTEALRTVPVPVLLLPDSSIDKLLQRPTVNLGSYSAIELQASPLTLLQMAAKRTIDISVASACLLLLTPLLLAIAAVIRIDSNGPILFRQWRSGLGGRPFQIFKFRTMTTLEDGHVATQAIKNDARVTRVGRFLRRNSLDELPQLFNVLQGNMSLAGPRPHAIAHDIEYARTISDYNLRLRMKPGITGWAQINGYRGETADISLMERRVQYDITYIKSWTLWLDAWIFIKTALLIIKSDERAY